MFKIDKANQIHGGKYDYSKVVYKNTDTKVIIICPVHGEFLQTPYHHINRGQGCTQCKGKRIQKTKSMKIEDFITKSNEIHNSKYNYDKSIYLNAHTKLIITCKKHGDFLQNPNNHIYNKCGCPSCGYNTSKTGNTWLNSLNIPQECREVVIYINNQKYKVDALYNNTIYEYFGYFWHGHPDWFNPDDINPKNKTRYSELYLNTLAKIEIFTNSSYNFIYTWGE